MSRRWNSRSLICAHKYDSRWVGWVLETNRARFSCTSTLCTRHTHWPNDVWGHTIYVFILTISTFLILVPSLPPLFCRPEGYIHTFLVEGNFWIKVTCSQSASFPAWPKWFSSVMFERNNNDRLPERTLSERKASLTLATPPFLCVLPFFFLLLLLKGRHSVWSDWGERAGQRLMHKHTNTEWTDTLSMSVWKEPQTFGLIRYYSDYVISVSDILRDYININDGTGGEF